MAFRPNIQSLALDRGRDLTVRGESDDEPLPAAIHVVVVPGQPAAGAAQVARAPGSPTGSDRLAGDAEEHGVRDGPGGAMGVESASTRSEVTSWTQSVHHRRSPSRTAGPDPPPGGASACSCPGSSRARPASRRSSALVAALEARARASRQGDAIPAGFTYLGQFIDHDITFDPTPFGARRAGPRRTVNLRTPRLDLDSLYGGGPDVQPYLYEPRRARAAAARPGAAARPPAQRRGRSP